MAIPSTSKATAQVDNRCELCNTRNMQAGDLLRSKHEKVLMFVLLETNKRTDRLYGDDGVTVRMFSFQVGKVLDWSFYTHHDLQIWLNCFEVA